MLSLWQCFTLMFLEVHSHHSIKAHCYPEQIKTNSQVGIKCLTQEPFSGTDRWTNDAVNSHWRCIKASLLSLSEYIIIGAGLQLNSWINWNTAADFVQITQTFSQNLVNRNLPLTWWLSISLCAFAVFQQTMTSELNNTQ